MGDRFRQADSDGRYPITYREYEAEALVVIPKVETDGAKVEVLPLVQCRNCVYAKLETVVDHQDYFCCTINRSCHFGYWFCADGKMREGD